MATINNLLIVLIPIAIWVAVIVFAVKAVLKSFAYHEKEIELLTQILKEMHEK